MMVFRSDRESAPPVGRAVLVRGVVQGVGFRPFVYRLAGEEGLAGEVGNDSEGVTIALEGPLERIEAFLARLERERPPLARIDAMEVRALPLRGRKGFGIVASQRQGRAATGIPADAALCDACRRELLDPADRRYRYAFINCTHCGPRYTITRRVPYDRPQTSMAAFQMCAACQQEYDDPASRRFHAQPNACAACGPRLWLCGPDGAAGPEGDAVELAVRALAEGEIVAIKGVGGFHLAVDARNEAAVRRLRERKRRHGKPLAVMTPDLDAARRLAWLSPLEEEQMRSAACPIVLARARTEAGLAASIAPGLPWLGLFLPYAPLHHLLFADGRLQALVMTSANLSEEPIAIDNAEALERLGGIADLFLMHDREILQRTDDSVAAENDGRVQLIRRARGYAPLGLELPVSAPPLVAVGGQLKQALALAEDKRIYQSQHLGDLDSPAGMEFFEHALGHLQRSLEIEPRWIAHDLHPGYLSTAWARRRAGEAGLELVGVQHHHAHLAACLAEHGGEGRAIGLALDGTGYGPDGAVWGGEIFLFSLEEFERFAHFAYAPMPGGEAAVREPWRMALGAMHAAALDVCSPQLRALHGGGERESALLRRMIERGVNAPLCSSLGRLFDAVACVALGRRVVDYEAQAAVELEAACIDEPWDVEGYGFALQAGAGGSGPLRLECGAMWRELIADLRQGLGAARIGARFHAGVAQALTAAAVRARAASGLERVALGGGCLLNRRLTRLLRVGLEAEGFATLWPERVSPGDGGLSYGQAAVAAARLARRAASSAVGSVDI